MSFQTIISETHGRVGLITLNRPQALNALNEQLVHELNLALDGFDADTAVGCIVVTGSEKAFAAGADIREMKDKSFAEVTAEDYIGAWDHITAIRKPIIAAVSGYALGGGFELALAADFIIATETARFALPEVTIGTVPGGGGAQRLARLVGKSKAMEMVLTGRMMDAAEAERLGIVARLVAADRLRDESLAIGEKIAGLSQPVVASAKRLVNAAYETTLEEGLLFERKSFHATFALADQTEGMAAFVEKRKPVFKNR